MADVSAPPPQGAAPQRGLSTTAKWVIGCSLSFLVGAAVLCAGIYFVVNRAITGIKEWAQAMEKYGDNIGGKGEVGTLHAQARSAAPYDAEKPPELTAERLAAYIDIRKEIEPALQKHAGLMSRLGGKQGQQPQFSDIMALLPAWSELKVEHAKLLVKHKMSPEEFQHITALVYGVLNAGPNSAPDGITPVQNASDKTAELIRGHKADLKVGEVALTEALLYTSNTNKYKPQGGTGGGSSGGSSGSGGGASGGAGGDGD